MTRLDVENTGICGMEMHVLRNAHVLVEWRVPRLDMDIELRIGW